MRKTLTLRGTTIRRAPQSAAYRVRDDNGTLLGIIVAESYDRVRVYPASSSDIGPSFPHVRDAARYLRDSY